MGIRIVRTGLFLLFAVLISVVVPLQPAMSADLAMRNPMVPKSEIKEHIEKLRQRPAAATAARRETRTPDPGAPLPSGVRSGFVAPFLQQQLTTSPAGLRRNPDHEAVRRRHAPAALQVFRH